MSFTAFFQKFLAARAIYHDMPFSYNVMKQHTQYLDNIAKQHAHFFGIAPPFLKHGATALWDYKGGQEDIDKNHDSFIKVTNGGIPGGCRSLQTTFFL